STIATSADTNWQGRLADMLRLEVSRSVIELEETRCTDLDVSLRFHYQDGRGTLGKLAESSSDRDAELRVGGSSNWFTHGFETVVWSCNDCRPMGYRCGSGARHSAWRGRGTVRLACSGRNRSELARQNQTRDAFVGPKKRRRLCILV
ncbi:hypothetical protein OIO90_005055, partial [Microbotryomycetes sp. JL221]